MMRRREFITLLGGAATWPLTARAQQVAVPVIGLLSSAEGDDTLLNGLRQALSETGYVNGRNITIDRKRLLSRYSSTRIVRRLRRN